RRLLHGRGDRRLSPRARPGVQRGAAAGAVVRVARMQLAALRAGAADARLAEQGALVRLAEPPFERPDLGVQRLDPVQLRPDELAMALRRRAAGGAVDLEREAAEVTQQKVAY